MKKKIINLVFSAIVLASCLVLSVCAKVYGGTSDGVSWSIELNNGEMEIHVDGDMPDYLNHSSTPWGKYITLAKKITVKEGTTSIGKNAFMYARQAHTVILPKTLESIGENAFAYCYDLQYINLPQGLVSVGNNAFASCKSISKIEFPDSLTHLGAYSFSACVSLNGADLSHTKITEIGEGTFSSCSSLLSVVLPDSVLAIEDAAFYNCVKYNPEGNAVLGLESINIPSNVLSIGNRAFYNCQLLSDLRFNCYPEVCEDTFYNVPATYTVTFKNSDGSEILSYVSPINTPAYYTGEMPVAESTQQYHFTFKGWDRPFEAVLGDTVYTAVYNKQLREYKITWVIDGVSKVTTQNYGTTPDYYWVVYPYRVPQKEGYTFVAWSPLIENVTGDVTYTALFVKNGSGDFDDDGTSDEDDLDVLSAFILGTGQLSKEQILRANVYTADDKDGALPEENINIKDLIFLRQIVAVKEQK